MRSRVVWLAVVFCTIAPTFASAEWRSVGTGDCPGRDVASSQGPTPDGARCNAAFNGYTAVCWDQACTYKNLPTASCTGGAHPGRMYTCASGSGGPPPAQIFTPSSLGRVWQESESGWSGVWTRRGDSNVFDAVWNKPGQATVHAVMTMTVSGNTVSIQRSSLTGAPEHTYRGQIASDGVSVSGIYTLGANSSTWSATITGGSSVPSSPSSGQTRSGSVVNLALHKPATQSSVYRGTGVDQGPQFGNDGILESQPRDPYLVVMTEADNPPWWQVDLQGVYTLTQLKLYNRKACCQERAKTVQVLLSTNGSNWERAYAHDGTTFDVLTVDLTGRTARYVRLQLAERVSLHFQECEVYGYANASPPIPQSAVAATPASQNVLNVSISPAQQEVTDASQRVGTVAEVSGGAPPYSYEWYNGDRKSQVTDGRVTWSNMSRPGTRDIKVVVRDSAGNSGEAHAYINVRGAGGQSAQPLPPTASSSPAAASQEFQTNRLGGDYRSFDLATADPALCQQQCLNESKCVAWTYVNPGVQGNQARCWLKSTIPGPTRNACCVSGTKEPTSIAQPSPPPSPSPTHAMVPISLVPVNIAGTWQPGARGETWTFTPLASGRYEAKGSGSSNAAGVATVIGNRFRLDYTWQDGGTHWGYYQMTVDPGGNKATGSFRDNRPQEGAVSMTRIAGP